MKTLLVVDDEYVVLDMLSMLLEGEGYRVRKASDGVEALALLVDDLPDVVLCDAQMPVLGGLGVLAAMAGDARLAAIPVILMVEAFGVAVAADGAAAVVLKPVRFGELLGVLARLGAAPDGP